MEQFVENYTILGAEEDGYSLEGLLSEDTIELSESQIALVVFQQTPQIATSSP